ncbi:phosphate/phosphite/phosphonate ABC transporter substrate-binding protein [Fodinicola feengrottensis]|uniref:phosphate/phosphite/phosphonate ABC transporter substrate-binding protein n=1 Tax=Fodinicola feengrottensis TaxID=435914 RepID=UPI002441CDE7|nr:PhnD/SsuA/transferrin family substrate-binding protein [Fodinicola feengrottensis]
MTLIMGAVAYDPKVVTIWNGFRTWLRDHDLPFDYVLYSNCERQVEDLVAGRIQAAWNSPLAWIRSQRLARSGGRAVRPLVMRDTDRDLTSVIVVRSDSAYEKPADLKDQAVGVGAVDSPQGTLIPRSFLRTAGLTPGENVTIRRYDVGVGLHGDHIGGERDAARALIAGEVEAVAVIDANHLLFGREGTFPAGSTRIIGQTAPYDHCNMTVVDGSTPELGDFWRITAVHVVRGRGGQAVAGSGGSDRLAGGA